MTDKKKEVIICAYLYRIYVYRKSPKRLLRLNPPPALDARINHLYNNITTTSRSGARSPGWEGSKAKPVTRKGSPALSRNCKEIRLQARTPARNGIITALADRRWSMPEKT